MRCRWFAFAIVACLVTQARAERVTKMFPIAAPVPKALRDLPAELTRVVTRAFTAELAPTPIEDVAEILGCDLDEGSGCLASIAEQVGADRVMFGRLARTDGDIVLTLSSFEPGTGVHARRFVLAGTTTDELVAALADRLEPPHPKHAPAIHIAPSIQPELPDPVTAPARISRGTWGLVVGGGTAAAAGIGFLFAANSLRDDILTAPDRTLPEIARLRALERAARTRLYIGTGLVAVGGTIATIGIVRAMLQRRSVEQLVDVVPERGGASVVVHLRWP